MADDAALCNDGLDLAPLIDGVGWQAFYHPFSGLRFTVALLQLHGADGGAAADEHNDRQPVKNFECI